MSGRNDRRSLLPTQPGRPTSFVLNASKKGTTTRYICRKNPQAILLACVVVCYFIAIERIALENDQSTPGQSITGNVVLPADVHVSEPIQGVRDLKNRQVASFTNLEPTVDLLMINSTDHNESSLKGDVSSSTMKIQPTKLPLCSRAQIRNGRWSSVLLPKPPYVRHETNPTWKCFPENAISMKQTPPVWKTWEWIPHDAAWPSSSTSRQKFTNTTNAVPKCEFTKWNSTLFCNLAQNKTILIVGDSLSWEQFISLTMLHGIYIRDREQRRAMNETVITKVCNKIASKSQSPSSITRIGYRRTDTLMNLPGILQEMERRHISVDVLILNRGAHFKPDNEVFKGVKRNIRYLHKWFQERQTLDALVIWRTTVPGHFHCEHLAEPFEGTVAEMERQIQYNGTLHDQNATKLFHWHEMKQQNQLITSLWEEYQLKHHINGIGKEMMTNRVPRTLLSMQTGSTHLDLASSNVSESIETTPLRNNHGKKIIPHVQILDAYDINILRHDSHRSRIPETDDCLHNCYPGKMDVYNTVLLHFLRQLKEGPIE